MKKIILGFALSFATLSFGQYYQDNNGWDDDYSYGNGGYYNDYDDERYFPDDYYYNYPNDYYPNDYYQGYYNDYRNSIVNINWNNFFTAHHLAPWQIREILYLNSLYSNFSTWNNFYRYNPDRWYYDRFYALNRILGPKIFVVFQNNYYHGHHPIVYFQNYRRSYYSAPRFAVMPRYRNININIYRVDRRSLRSTNNPIIRVAQRSYDRNRGEFRNNNSTTRNNENRTNNSFRSNNANTGRNNNIRNEQSKSVRTEGIRNQTNRNESRANTPKRSEAPRSIRSSNESRSNKQRIERSNNNQRQNKSSSSRSIGRFTRN